MRGILFSLLALMFFSCANNVQENKKTVRQTYDKGYSYLQNGWVVVHVEGGPYERGKQLGYLTAAQYQSALACYRAMTYETTGMKLDFFIDQANQQFKDKIPQEYLDEMRGMVDGLALKNVQSSVDEIIGWNGWIDIIYGWWPTVSGKFPSFLKKDSRCSAFMATGSYSKDRQIIAAHSTFDQFWNVQSSNILLEVQPEQGNRFVMQTAPCFLASMTDFYVNDKGIVALETSTHGFLSYDPAKSPSFIRLRQAIQYAKSIDEFILLFHKNSNGGNGASWLLGDLNTNEIARYEEGLYFQSLEKKKDGYFFGCNVTFDPGIRNLESEQEDFNDIRTSIGGRRLRFMEIFANDNIKLDIEKGKKVISDHYDVFAKRTRPWTNTICAHGDVTSNPKDKLPFVPYGAVDAIIGDSSMLKKLSFMARWGRPCGEAFDKDTFFNKHPEWNWQQAVLQSRPHQEWTLIKISE